MRTEDPLSEGDSKEAVPTLLCAERTGYGVSLQNNRSGIHDRIVKVTKHHYAMAASRR